MSIVVATLAQVEPGKGPHRVWLGSDGRSVRGGVPGVVPIKWVRGHPTWWVGVSGDLRAQQVLEQDRAAWCSALSISELIRRLRLTLVRHQCREDDNGEAGFPTCGQSFLVAQGDGGRCGDGERLYEVDSSFAYVEVPVGGYAAEGSGRKFALGAMYAETRRAGDHPGPMNLLTLGLKAAASFDVMCGRPFMVWRAFSDTGPVERPVL